MMKKERKRPLQAGATQGTWSPLPLGALKAKLQQAQGRDEKTNAPLLSSAHHLESLRLSSKYERSSEFGS